jgi:hypothetical protein
MPEHASSELWQGEALEHGTAHQNSYKESASLVKQIIQKLKGA